MGLQRPGQVVYWLQQVLGIEAITKEVLASGRGTMSRGWRRMRATARFRSNGRSGTCARKTTWRRICGGWRNAGRFGVYFIFQAMEQGWTYRPGTRLVAREPGRHRPTIRSCISHRARYRYYYFYLRDEVMGPMIRAHGDLHSV